MTGEQGGWLVVVAVRIVDYREEQVNAAASHRMNEAG
jgi:hypothetical protein